MPVKRWSMSGNFIYRHHVEPRFKLYSPKEESFPIPLKYIDVSRTTRTNLDVMLERRMDDYWNIDGSRDLSDSWTGFTQLALLAEKPPDHLWPALWTKLGRNAKLKEKQKWSNEKPKFDNARRLRGINFIDLEDKEFKETIRNARKNLETPMAPAMSCQILMKICASGASNNFFFQDLRAIWESVNPQDCVWKNLYQIIMRTILQEKVTIHSYITIWYTNLSLCLKP